MSASPVFSSAALGRPFIFSPRTSAEFITRVRALPKLAAVVPASRLEVRPAPEMVSSGIPQLDSLAGGFARGCLTEICGTASSGRTSVLLLALARATQRGEVCALVDASDAFDPASAEAAGMQMTRLLWVRCGKKADEKIPLTSGERSADTATVSKFIPPSRITHRSLTPVNASRRFRCAGKQSSFRRWETQLAQMLKVTDLLLQSNGFGMIVLDLGDIPTQSARRISLASWFRFRRAIEHTPTVLLVLEQQPIAGSCSSVQIKVTGQRSQVSGRKLPTVSCQFAENRASHTELLDEINITAELLRSRLERKSPQPVVSFVSRAKWAG